MEAISINNLRSLSQNSELSIKPITILIGKNGSGKSSFLRFFPLLRQTAESRTRETLLWFGKYVDFGTFKEAISRSADTKSTIDISFSIKGLVPPAPRYIQNSVIVDIVKIKLSIGYDESSGRSYTQAMQIVMNDDDVKFEASPSGDITVFTINSENILALGCNFLLQTFNRIIPRLTWAGQNEERLHARYHYRYNYLHFPEIILKTLVNELSSFSHGSTSFEKKVDLIYRNKYTKNIDFLTSLISNPVGTNYWKDKVGGLTVQSSKFIKIKSLFVVGFLPYILMLANEYLSIYGRNISYIAPVRATAERYYREQGLAVDKVDHLGQNLAMFLRTLADTERIRFKEWTKKYLGFEASARHNKGQIDLTIRESGSDKDYNLIDVGFGFSQILPVAAQLWAMTENVSRKKKYEYLSNNELGMRIPKLLAIEQPELHLHPCYQAKIADSLVATIEMAKAQQNDVRILVETHSESIINRLGQLVQQKQISNDDISIILFSKNSPDEATKITTSTFDDNGYLLSWPYGFFEPDCE